METQETAQALYLNLLKKCIRGTLYGEDLPIPRKRDLEECKALLVDVQKRFAPWLQEESKESVPLLTRDPRELYYLLHRMSRQEQAQTMTSETGVENVEYCVKKVLEEGVPGDLIETGVWKGGLTIWMRGILKAYGATERKVWVADSFQGLPPPDPETHLADAINHHLLETVGHLSVSLKDVQESFRRYDLLDEQVCFLEGWFAETLPQAPIKRLAVARLDGDWYESTRDALCYLYPKLSAGGYLIIDDYGLPLGCRQAVDEFRAAHQITEEIRWVNHQTIFWQVARPIENRARVGE